MNGKCSNNHIRILGLKVNIFFFGILTTIGSDHSDSTSLISFALTLILYSPSLSQLLSKSQFSPELNGPIQPEFVLSPQSNQ